MQDRSISRNQCMQCTRKSSLITKYLQLIQLLKKKNQKTSRSTTILSNRTSIIGNQTLSVAPSELLSQSFAKYKIIQVICKLFQQRIMDGFKHIAKEPPNVKLALLLMVNKYTKSLRFTGFQQLKRLAQLGEHPEKLEQFQKSQKTEELQGSGASLSPKSDILYKNKQSIVNQVYEKQGKFLAVKSSNSKFIKLSESQKQLQKSLQQMKAQNQILKHKMQFLQKQLQENIRRQFKQSQKKKESLEMLAEDIAQKNDIISELQGIIKSYECRIDKSDAVLEDEFEMMRKQVQQLTKRNQKLQFDVMKYKDRSASLVEKNSDVQTKYKAMVEENEKLKYKIFDLRNIEQKNQGSVKDAKEIVEKFTKKMNDLKLKQTQLNERLRSISKVVRQMMKMEYKKTEVQSIKNIQNILEQLQNRAQLQVPSELEKPSKSSKQGSLEELDLQSKIMAIFSYIKSLSASNKQISSQNDKKLEIALKKMLSAEEQKILNDHIKLFKQNHNISCIVKDAIEDQQQIGSQRRKTKFIKNQDSFVKQSEKSQLNGKNALEDSDQIIHGDMEMFDSVLDLMGKQQGNPVKELSIDFEEDRQQVRGFNAQKQQNQEPESDLVSRDYHAARREPKQNLTLKLLQMEIEKNGLVEKISDLKNKYMHIRNIVYNLLKSLSLTQLNLPHRNQTLGVLQVVFDFFQYSQEEKQDIFGVNRKKKKFFGFFE